jgi:hypothetical protein
MKKQFPIFFTAAFLLTAVMSFAQTAQPYDEETIIDVQTYARVAELKLIVALTPEQEQSCTAICKQHYNAIYKAVHVETDIDKSAQMMRESKKLFDTALMGLLTERQQAQYIRALVKDDIHQETMRKIEPLQKSGEYTKEELDKFYEEIYNYYMTVKISNTRNQHNIEQRKENVSQLKKIAPKVIKEANARSKGIYKGKPMGKNDNWK